MTASTPLRITALLAAALAVAACQRQEPAAAPEAETAATDAMAEPAAEAATDTIPGTDVISATPNMSSEAGVQPQVDTLAGLEAKDFAGSFSTEGAKLELAPDGTYVLTVRAESAGADLQSGGTWTAEDGGARVLLDPGDKSGQDRSYTVVSADELRADEGGQVLRRDGAQ